MSITIRKASRTQVPLKIAITGPSGSGKTYGALKLAFGLGSKVCLIDTENGSGDLYADLGDYDVIPLTAPFTTEKYGEAIRAAVDAGYDVLVIDSISHAWEADGGLLSQKEQLDARGGNSYTNWATITKKHERFKADILQARIHTICTMRSKQDYVLEQNNGKATPKKVGMAPVQREGMEYEFTVVFDVAMNHEAGASKDRTGLFDGKFVKLAEQHGKQLRDWLNTAAAPAPRPEPFDVTLSITSINPKWIVANDAQQRYLLRHNAEVAAAIGDIITAKLLDSGEVEKGYKVYDVQKWALRPVQDGETVEVAA